MSVVTVLKVKLANGSIVRGKQKKQKKRLKETLTERD